MQQERMQEIEERSFLANFQQNIIEARQAKNGEGSSTAWQRENSESELTLGGANSCEGDGNSHHIGMAFDRRGDHSPTAYANKNTYSPAILLPSVPFSEVQGVTIQLRTPKMEDDEELLEVNLVDTPPQSEKGLDKEYETQDVIITLRTPETEDNFEMIPPLNDEKKDNEEMGDVPILEINHENGKGSENEKEIIPQNGGAT